VSVEFVEFIVEEPSMEAALRELAPKLLGDVPFEVYPHQSKDELLKRLPDRLNGYSKRRARDAWFRDHCRVVVIVDRDDDDCKKLKKRIEAMAKQAGLTTRSSAKRGASSSLVVRLAIEELEAWYFGDWEAVTTAYPRVSATVPKKEGFRDPDAVAGGTWEAFERVMQSAGYFSGGLRKIEAAIEISEHMNPARNSSRSFQVFRDAIKELAA
jgi:hypothetical protein